MLSGTKSIISQSQQTEEASLKLIADDLLCGRNVSSVDKKLHPKLVPYLQKAKTNAITSHNKSLELKINRIIQQLTLSSPITPRTPKPKKQKPEYKSVRFSRNEAENSNPDMSVYDEEVQKLIHGRSSFDEIDPKQFTPLRSCMKMKRDQAARTQNYDLAKKIHEGFNKFTDYIRSRPKPPKHAEDLEYLDNIRKRYAEAVKRKEYLQNKFEYENEKIKKEDMRILNMTSAMFNSQLQEIEDEKENIMDGKGFQPSRQVLYHRTCEQKYAKMCMFDEAKSEKRKADEIEKKEREDYIRLRGLELRAKRMEIEEKKQKQFQILSDKSDYKHATLHQKEVKMIATVNDEINCYARKIEENGYDLPDEYEILYYTTRSVKQAQSYKEMSRTYSIYDTTSRQSLNASEFTSYNTATVSRSSNVKLSILTENKSNECLLKTDSKENLTSQIESAEISKETKDETKSNFSEEVSISMPISANSSMKPLYGTSTVRSLSNLQLKAIANDNDASSKNDGEYDFVFEGNENLPKDTPINTMNIEKENKHFNSENSSVTESNSEVVNYGLAPGTVSESLNDTDRSYDIIRKRARLDYEKYLTPHKSETESSEIEKSPRQRLNYESFLRSPKTTTSPSLHSTTATEVSIHDDRQFSSYTSSYVSFYSYTDQIPSYISEEEQEYEIEEDADYNDITEDY